MIKRLSRLVRGALREPDVAREEALVLADLARFAVGTGRLLRTARARRPERGTAVFVSLAHHVNDLKVHALLATALRLEGWRPLMFVIEDARWPGPYFRAAGLGDVIHLDELVTPEDAEEARRVAAETLAGDVSVPALKELRYHGSAVGVQTLSSLSRRFEQGRIALDDPPVRAALESLVVESVRAVLGAERLIDRYSPEIAVFTEMGYAGFGSIADAALQRGLNVVNVQTAGMHRPDVLVLKRYTAATRRLHSHSLSQESWQLVRSLPFGPREEAELDGEFEVRYFGHANHPEGGLQEGKLMKPPEQVRRELGLDPAKPTAVVFSHILWDANMFYGNDLFDDQEQWLVETVRTAVANPHANWVVKLHPANLFKTDAQQLNDEIAIREAIGELPPHVKLLRPDTDINTYSLFGVTDVGVTIRGTIGMELPCFGVPVLTAGTGRYSGLGFTHDSDSREEYFGRLASIHELPRLSEEERELARRHAHALFRLRPFPFTSWTAEFMPFARRGHPLHSNSRLLLRSPAEVERAADLRDVAEWIEDRSRVDYLAADPPRALQGAAA